MTKPFIMVAPNGAKRGKDDHTALPIQIIETVNTAKACYLAGAHALHLHVRDDQGKHAIDAGLYTEALTELEIQVPELAVQITTEAAGIFDVKEQLACLETLKPKWASISVREMARDKQLALKAYALCADQGTKIQHILYDTADIEQYLEWQKQHVIKTHQNEVLFVLGRYSKGMTSSPENLKPFRDALPDIENWMVCAFGPDEHACLVEAARQGGGVRVGFENSLTNADGTKHADNAASVTALINTIEG
ncbi:3-keto-5-aminohexanoate cleavage protein [Leucothrix arctica]|uniref:3-keto-5-aminohexanoate cleavage protein n=1 Tax=Leucothrix arctica TaxID=1481894 RepID=A0A317CN76_9GAMM|nr:3-keto-5-aminohexanoate cleavage protein [Leucothrix arctica]PWQ99637.1 3-keto-5-aminohexanoate cleavage protein [Leucothrix arctica]